MFSDLDNAFHALRERAPEPRFDPAAVVRRRGQRRTHRQVAVAGVAVVGVLAGAGALAVVHDPGGRVEPAASARASASGGPDGEYGFPDVLLLKPGDVPPRFAGRVQRDSRVISWPVNVSCEGARLPWDSLEHVRADRQILFKATDEDVVVQNVTLYDPGWATRAVADYAAFVAACSGGRGLNHTVLGRDLGGDESVLYRQEWTVNANFLLFMRIGDRLTVIQLAASLSETEVRALATTAADRLGS